MLELSLNIQDANQLLVQWTHGEQKLNRQTSQGDRFLRDLIHHSMALSHWKGPVDLAMSTSGSDVDFQWVDLFQGGLSYQWVEYGKGGRKRGVFQRLAYGEVDVAEFQELVFAAVTDLGVSLGTLNYRELTGQDFPSALYEKLAKSLGRPYHLPEEGDLNDEEIEASDEEGWVWESDEEDEGDSPMAMFQEGPAGPRAEFLALGQFIKNHPDNEESN